jgi:hypothetical protein
MAVQLPDPSVRQDAAQNAIEEREQRRRHQHSVRTLLEKVLRDMEAQAGADLGTELRNLAFRMANHPLKPDEVSPQAKQQLSAQPELLQSLASEGVLSASTVRELSSAPAPGPLGPAVPSPVGPMGGAPAPVAPGGPSAAALGQQLEMPKAPPEEKPMTRLEAGAPAVLPEVG